MTEAKMIAHVYMTKEVEQDNWERGCEGNRNFITQERFTVEFKDTQDLKEELAGWAHKHFDIPYTECVKELRNEIENNRFDYNQNEDDDANRKDITEENPDGWLADYSFYIDKVTTEIKYTF